MRLHQNTVFKEDTFFFSVVSKFRPAPAETQRRVPYKVILNHHRNMFWLSEILSAKYFLSFSANKLQSAFQLQCIYISWSAFFKYMTAIIKSDEQALSKSKMFHEFICTRSENFLSAARTRSTLMQGTDGVESKRLLFFVSNWRQKLWVLMFLTWKAALWWEHETLQSLKYTC